MRKLVVFLLLLCAVIAHLSALDCDHPRGRTQNDLLPNLTLGMIPRPITENSAVAFFGEAGRRNYRANGTFGWIWGFEDRFKLSSEYLTQKLGYRFSTGKKHRWVQQYAAGFEYEHDFCNPIFLQGNLGFSYSYAESHNLSSRKCGDDIFHRRIAGSNGYEISAGTTFSPWPWGFFHVDADYDSVNYHLKFRRNKRITGFGVSASYHQELFYHLFFDIIGEFKRPYNYGKVALGWYDAEWSGFAVSLYGSHVRGKSRLPSNTSAGLELVYIFGDMICCPTEYAPCYCGPELASWVGQSAVYMPSVLAISEEKRVRVAPPPPTCVPITVIPIPNFSFTTTGNYSIDITPYFKSNSGQTLTFTATGLPAGSTISNGVISGPVLPNNNTYTVSVTATPSGGCAGVTQSFTISFPCGVPTSTGIPSLTADGEIGSPFTPINVSVYFTSPNGQPLTYTASGLVTGVSINPSTGVISGTIPGDESISVIITATSICGSISETFTLTFSGTGPT